MGLSFELPCCKIEDEISKGWLVADEISKGWLVADEISEGWLITDEISNEKSRHFKTYNTRCQGI
ncbi:MAG: hypothetical protein IJN92_10895 [Lachnospiraceae bacterium]|nr:hypothetical protein [Lachnospiraceae bacterium]